MMIGTGGLTVAKHKTVAELESALNSVVEQLNMGMIRPRHGKRLMQMYRKQLERKREMKP